MNAPDTERARSLTELESSFILTCFPASVNLDTANLCNYRCAGCARAVMTRPKGKMPIELAKKILSEVASTAPETKVWLSFYGEPTLITSRVAYLAQYGAKLGCRDIRLNTNASHLNSDGVEMLLDCGITDIFVSLDAVTGPTYDAVRHPGYLDRVTANTLRLVRRARQINSPVRIHAQFVDGPANKHEREPFIERWLAEGVLVKIKDFIQWTKPVDDPAPSWRIACPWAFNTFVVLADGGVACCSADYDAKHVFGNMRDSSIASLWNNEMRIFREQHLQHNFGELPEICHTCGDWNVTVSEVRRAPTP